VLTQRYLSQVEILNTDVLSIDFIKDYNLEVFKRLDLLSQRAQVMVTCFGIRPYELFASGSPIPPTNVIVPRLSDGLLAASYDFKSHRESLSTDSPTVSASPEFENLYS